MRCTLCLLTTAQLDWLVLKHELTPGSGTDSCPCRCPCPTPCPSAEQQQAQQAAAMRNKINRVPVDEGALQEALVQVGWAGQGRVLWRPAAAPNPAAFASGTFASVAACAFSLLASVCTCCPCCCRPLARRTRRQR